jgi:hypothetical protein
MLIEAIPLGTLPVGWRKLLRSWWESALRWKCGLGGLRWVGAKAPAADNIAGWWQHSQVCVT